MVEKDFWQGNMGTRKGQGNTAQLENIREILRVSEEHGGVGSREVMIVKVTTLGSKIIKEKGQVTKYDRLLCGRSYQ